jgi:glycosyltransferase involved in cell wall biosynthesis
MKKATILLCGPPVSALGGGPTHIRNLLASPLSDRFHLVHFETGSRGTESPAKDEAWPRTVLRIVTSPFALAWRILGCRPGVVHLNTSMSHKGFWRDLAYMLVARLMGRRIVLQLHGGSLPELCAGFGMRQLVRSAFSIPDSLVALARSEKRALEDLGVGARLSIVPNGIDIKQYAAAADRVHSGRVRRMAFLGRLIRPKGMFEAMEAVRLLRAEPEFSNVELWIAGSGPATDEIERWIRENSLENAVKLVGSVYGSAKVDFLRLADVFVFPTYHGEGLPYVILESLAAGTPVIATRVAGIPDVIVDRVHGILIDARSPRQIVDAVHELSQSEEGLRAIAKNCRARAVQEYSLDRLAARFEELYEGLLA